MKLWLVKTILLAAALMLVIWILVLFSFSDFIGTYSEDIETKPWRPMARVAFGFIMITLVIFTAGAVLQMRKR